MANIAEIVKKQTDRILRQRALNGSEGVVVRGVSSGAGAPAPTVNNPPADLAAHKSSGDHDGRYYTESEIDGMLNFVGLSDTPLAYTGEGGKIAAVKATEDGLEFVEAPPAENGIPTGGANNQLLAKDGATDYVVKWMDAPAAANGLPEGGTAGQLLEKIDGTDYNTQWADPAAANPILQWLKYFNAVESPISTSANLTKGSIFVPVADYYLYGIGVLFSEAATQTVKARVYELNGTTQVGAALVESGNFVGIGALKHYTYKFVTPILLSAGTRYIVAMSNTTSGATAMRAALDGQCEDDLTGFVCKSLHNTYINNSNPGNGATWTITTSGGKPYGVSLLVEV